MYRSLSSMDFLYLLIIAVMLLGLYLQSRVKHVYKEYSAVPSRARRPAQDVAMEMLAAQGNNLVTPAHISGQLTDHYNPQTETLGLSDSVWNSSSVAALAVAAHESGHAMQKYTGYFPLILRTAAVPVVNYGSRLSMPIFLLGLIFSMRPLLTVGIVLFSLAVFFSLVTLPVEFDASRRGLRMLADGGYLAEDELVGARKVLRAAALTYVVAALSALLQLIRLIAISNRRSRD